MTMRGCKEIQNLKRKMKNKILFCLSLLLFVPMISLASEATTTPLIGGQAKSVLEIVQKDEKKEEIRKQLNDTIDLCSALISKIQVLEERVLERVGILVSWGNLSKDSQAKIDEIQKKLDETIASANDRVNNKLPKLAETVMNASKPNKSVAAFKKEVNNIKSEITTAHKLVVDMIFVVKKENE